MVWTEIAAQIAATTGDDVEGWTRRALGGGCINQAYGLSRGDRAYFVKLNGPQQGEMFAAEALGLQDLAAAGAVRVPEPICWGTAAGASYLVLEWLDLEGRGDRAAWYTFGQRLAQLHQWQPSAAIAGDPLGSAKHVDGAGRSQSRFGWRRDNTIGATPQPNPWCDDWAEFWRVHRIGHQLNLARRRGAAFPSGDRLLELIADLLADHPVRPSLIHGDLWSGNGAIAADGTPVIFDPAPYWGDREADLAMTELFGGFPAAFYDGYRDQWPLDAGYERRKILYNLYHILNHFNLFGGSYAAQANAMIAQLVG